MHFYIQTDSGVQPRHFVEMSSRPGELRPSRISDMRKATERGEIWYPSVTTILDVLAKPALTNWKIDQHLDMAWERIMGESKYEELVKDDYIAEIKRLTELKMDVAPAAGSDIHKSIERFAKQEMTKDDPDYRLCHDVFTMITANAFMDVRTPLESEIKFVNPLGYGGQVDLSCESWIIDIKSKQFADKFKPGKMAYDEHRMQLAAYREGLQRSKEHTANVFICLENGAIDFHEHSEQDMQKGWRLFQHALGIWQEQNQWRYMQ